jgi:hypothetical protein
VTSALPIASSTTARTTFGVRIVLAVSSVRRPGAFKETARIAMLCRRMAMARYAQMTHDRTPRIVSTAPTGT